VPSTHPMTQRVLIIEDDPLVRTLARDVLVAEGLQVDELADGPEPASVGWDDYLAVMLDLGLPSADGVELCRQIRARSNVPVVMITGRDHDDDVVNGLDAGADDYVTKPFSSSVLGARVRAVTRRGAAPHGGTQDLLRVGELVVDELGARAFLASVELALSPTEMSLLACLARHAGRVLSRQDLLEQVWGYDYLGDSRLVDMAVLRLRQKLREATPDGDGLVVTVRGEGYRIDR
jgi:DNA-binding response OmpR family regulator